jgi:hypothetical protein
VREKEIDTGREIYLDMKRAREKVWEREKEREKEINRERKRESERKRERLSNSKRSRMIKIICIILVAGMFGLITQKL